MKDLASRIIKKDIVALAKAITLIENNSLQSKELLINLYPHRKSCHKIGITGPPGAGKSTLVSQILKKYIKKGEKIGVLCVDPSSPFNGGAILGDRVRMQSVYSNKNIFIRSLATRGALGGLSNSISDLEILFEAFGFDKIIYETVGVGQIELDVASYAECVVMVVTPESGDDIQMMKAGLIECSDIIAINKSDRSGSDKMKVVLNQVFELNHDSWKTPILKTVALKNEGIDNICSAIEDHRKYSDLKGLTAKKNTYKYLDSVKSIAKEYMFKEVFTDEVVDKIKKEMEKPLSARISPYQMFYEINKK